MLINLHPAGYMVGEFTHPNHLDLCPSVAHDYAVAIGSRMGGQRAISYYGLDKRWSDPLRAQIYWL